MRVVAKQNIWTDGRAYVVGEAFELSEALAQQLACDGLVELAPAQVEPAQVEPAQVEPAQVEPAQVEKPAKSKRGKKK